jgi:hypothetical protein
MCEVLEGGSVRALCTSSAAARPSASTTATNRAGSASLAANTRSSASGKESRSGVRVSKSGMSWGLSSKAAFRSKA